MNWNKAQFLYSAEDEASLKIPSLPEVAFVGRSNVGKSSLLNHLLGQKLAHVSKTPGKTKLLNFFEVDEKLLLVDLPGYGYAKLSAEKREAFGPMVDGYLKDRVSLKVVCHLIDSRHGFSEEDKAFAAWAEQCLGGRVQLLTIFTKSDLVTCVEPKPSAFNYSIKDGRPRLALRNYLVKAL